jgi:hypothetical protein
MSPCLFCKVEEMKNGNQNNITSPAVHSTELLGCGSALQSPKSSLSLRSVLWVCTQHCFRPVSVQKCCLGGIVLICNGSVWTGGGCTGEQQEAGAPHHVRPCSVGYPASNTAEESKRYLKDASKLGHLRLGDQSSVWPSLSPNFWWSSKKKAPQKPYHPRARLLWQNVWTERCTLIQNENILAPL